MEATPVERTPGQDAGAEQAGSRFHPSCSAYAKTAVETHGALRGSWLAVRRLVKCQPFHPGGFDYVPPASGRVKPGRKGYGEMVSAGPPGPPERGSS